MVSPIDAAWALLKGNPNWQMFTDSSPDYTQSWRFANELPKYRRLGTVHPAIAAMLARQHSEGERDETYSYGSRWGEPIKQGADWISNLPEGFNTSIHEQKLSNPTPRGVWQDPAQREFETTRTNPDGTPHLMGSAIGAGSSLRGLELPDGTLIHGPLPTQNFEQGRLPLRVGSMEHHDDASAAPLSVGPTIASFESAEDLNPLANEQFGLGLDAGRRRAESRTPEYSRQEALDELDTSLMERRGINPFQGTTPESEWTHPELLLGDTYESN